MKQANKPPLLPQQTAGHTCADGANRFLMQRSKTFFGARWYQLAHSLGWRMDDAADGDTHGPPMLQVEDHPRGYPRLSALLAVTPSFQVYRRFSKVRTRLLLLKQDEVSELETQLETVDREEPRKLFLGNRRRDTNPERKKVIASLDVALAQYDELLERNNRIFSIETALNRHPTSLRNWTLNNPDLAREETAYTGYGKDLCYVAASFDNEFSLLQHILSSARRSLFLFFGKVPRQEPSRDPNLFVPSGTFLPKLTRTLIAWIVIGFLLVPIPINNALDSDALRMAVVVVFSALLIAAMAGFTKAKTVELFISGATYAAVLVVFISGNASRP